MYFPNTTAKAVFFALWCLLVVGFTKAREVSLFTVPDFSGDTMTFENPEQHSLVTNEGNAMTLSKLSTAPRTQATKAVISKGSTVSNAGPLVAKGNLPKQVGGGFPKVTKQGLKGNGAPDAVVMPKQPKQQQPQQQRAVPRVLQQVSAPLSGGIRGSGEAGQSQLQLKQQSQLGPSYGVLSQQQQQLGNKGPPVQDVTAEDSDTTASSQTIAIQEHDDQPMTPPSANKPNVVSNQLDQANVHDEASDDDEWELLPEFDFIVGGFAKCGTTSVLFTLGSHPEIDMAAQEQCAVAAPALADAAVLSRLDATIESMPSVQERDDSKKRAFKCPTTMTNFKSIIRLEKHSPKAKFVVGIRHPVKMMQSFYNYRVTETYERGLAGTESIPAFMDLVTGNAKPWKGVSLSSVRFDLFLKQLGKTEINPEEFIEMSSLTELGYELAVKPSNFTVFLYTIDQLEDTDEARTAQLRLALQSYLGLTAPIEPFGHANKNHMVGDDGHPETIDICDQQYVDIRKKIVENGIKSAAWLKDHFLQSPDVIVANPDHFVETLKSWSMDPCIEEIEVKPEASASVAVDTDLTQS